MSPARKREADSMQRSIAFLLGCQLLLPAAADELSGPGRKTLISEDWGTVYCLESCKVRADALSQRFVISTEKGPMALQRMATGWVLQAPNQNLQVRRQFSADSSENLLVQFNSAAYRFQKKGKDFIWSFPEDRVFFNLREGELRGALGPSGSFKMHKHTGGVSYAIESESGQTEVLLGRKKTRGKYVYQMVKQSGQPLSEHPYLVKGVLFDNGPVGIFIKMPPNPVIDALDWTQLRTFANTVEFPQPKVVETPVKERDPLQAIEAGPDEDPLGTKRKPFEKDRSMFDVNATPSPSDGQWSQPPK
jgi:hypothetical protein